MKRYIYIFILLAIIAIYPGKSSAQQLDTLAIVRFENVEYLSYSELQFDINLCRISDQWDAFANGTFQFRFDQPGFSITDQNVEIILMSSQLPTAPITGTLPEENYHIAQRVINGKFSVSIFGPKEYMHTALAGMDDCINLGTFVIRTLDGEQLPGGLEWVRPVDYYQAAAYKVMQDPPFPENIIAGYKDDNIEMGREFGNYTLFEDGRAPLPDFNLAYFDVQYAGIKDVRMTWETTSEGFAEGFIIYRGIKPIEITDPALVNYNFLAASYVNGPFATESRAKGTRTTGAYYELEYDSVEFRGPDYCYALYYEDQFGEIHFLAYDCTPVPKSVIARATPLENPFTSSTTIQYEVSDDVILTARVYDLTGREVETLIQRQQIPKGSHEITFTASEFASQGLYDVVFIAYPIEDPSIELSTAVVKLQLIR